MNKSFIFLLFFCFFIFSLGLARAQNLTATAKRPFGGKVLNAKAIEIEALEAASFECLVPGTSIEVSVVNKAPTSYLIPVGVISKTKNPTRVGQWILGTYNPTPTMITCTEVATGATEIVELTPMIMYGTSK